MDLSVNRGAAKGEDLTLPKPACTDDTPPEEAENGDGRHSPREPKRQIDDEWAA